MEYVLDIKHLTSIIPECPFIVCLLSFSRFPTWAYITINICSFPKPKLFSIYSKLGDFVTDLFARVITVTCLNWYGLRCCNVFLDTRTANATTCHGVIPSFFARSLCRSHRLGNLRRQIRNQREPTLSFPRLRSCVLLDKLHPGIRLFDEVLLSVSFIWKISQWLAIN